ncbi:holin [Escherichia phage phiKP26]|uniref:Holin n=9 Tax=Rogunavirinae TaxID=2732046 RepID=A0A067YYT9_9CAUD|nr:holin [Enterobacteria phage vB_EcoS_Rogue1]YP_009055393.1 holin [Escherichia phage vB_EcoS_AHS24]YP_009614738.1 holin [Escherichia phage phiKP26]YP_009615880.1 holin [Escherichia phage C119]YP_009784129.1 holin [Enterobacteria phage phiJLA23]YP_009791900.1 holin [Shigella phage Sd1]YP_009791981.1 holin [Shigella phage Sf12]AHI60519.1 holin [Escherichia phage bV_EcoS_AHP24]WCI99836.1 holin [Escherichia phage vB_EcoS-UDF157lw]AFM76614.1 putative holin [Enterobacteria phage vB_EcoS_Rogue1]
MKHFYDAAALSGSGVAMGGGLSDNTIIGIIGLVIAVCFGIFGAWLRWRDSKALHKALEDGDIREAMRIRSK